MTEVEFYLALEKIGISLSSQQKAQFLRYYQLLVEWNARMNLTAITEHDQVYLKHFYDSATLAVAVDFSKEDTFCDIGTGAGFPGIVIKIIFPHLQVTLVDALNKRLIFLKQVIDQLGLIDVQLVHARAEEYAVMERERFDVVTARAVASLDVLLEYCLPLIKPHKYFIAMRGDISREISGVPIILKKLEGKQLEITKLILPNEGSCRNLILFSKDNYTDKKYPRKNSEIVKKPLI